MIERTKEGDVHVVVMKNGENALDLDFLTELNEQLDAVEKESDGAAALVLAGEGKFFSNGINLPFLMGADPDTQQKFGAMMESTIKRVLLLPIPTVAALNGHAFAGGAFLALACDFRVQREDRGWFCFSEVDVGVPIGVAMMTLLRTKLPPATARESTLTGRRYDADAAIAAGISDAKASEAELIPAAIALVAPLANKERGIFTHTKRLLYSPIAESFSV